VKLKLARQSESRLHFQTLAGRRFSLAVVEAEKDF
jgi:hypothetical protein